MTLDGLLLISLPFFHSRFGAANSVQRPPWDKWTLEYIVLECIGNALNEIPADTYASTSTCSRWSLLPRFQPVQKPQFVELGQGAKEGGKERGGGVERQRQVGLERGDMRPPSILPVLFSFDSNKDPTFLYACLMFPYVIIRLIFFSGLLVLCRTSTNSPRLTVAQKDPPWIPRKNAPCGNKLFDHLALVLRRSFSTEKEIFLFVM